MTTLDMALEVGCLAIAAFFAGTWFFKKKKDKKSESESLSGSSSSGAAANPSSPACPPRDE